MAEQLSDFEEARGAAWAHDWHSYEDYLTVHHQHMSALIEAGKVLRSGLSIIETREGRRLLTVQIRGRVECAKDVLVFVDKWLEARRGRQNRPEVKGYSYSYHAWLRNTDQTLLRYDSSHGLGAIHRHRWASGHGEVVEPISIGELPTLSDFIEEALALADAARGERA